MWKFLEKIAQSEKSVNNEKAKNNMLNIEVVLVVLALDVSVKRKLFISCLHFYAQFFRLVCTFYLLSLLRSVAIVVVKIRNTQQQSRVARDFC